MLPGRHDRADLEALIERDWTNTWRRSPDGTPGDETQFISWLSRNRGNHVGMYAGS